MVRKGMGDSTMDCVKISSKGRVTIPAEIRKTLNLESGTYLEIRLSDAGIVLKPLKKGALDRLYGMFDDKNVLSEMEREHAGE
jgi:AbrB family looped-hinge helix DNA binding protein